MFIVYTQNDGTEKQRLTFKKWLMFIYTKYLIMFYSLTICHRTSSITMVWDGGRSFEWNIQHGRLLLSHLRPPGPTKITTLIYVAPGCDMHMISTPPLHFGWEKMQVNCLGTKWEHFICNCDSEGAFQCRRPQGMKLAMCCKCALFAY